MRLNQGIHAEQRRFGHDVTRGFVVQDRQHDENGVSAVQPGLRHLARIDDEILGEDRPVKFSPYRRQIGVGAAEIGRVDRAR